ncbi:MAG: ATP-binding protein, partial [Nonomuraea sp.]|nr:ATP-binding protein [Nonomuraea sp.]
VNCFDGASQHSVDDVRIALDLDDDVPVMLCDVRRRASAKEVMITLVEHSLRTLTTAN